MSLDARFWIAATTMGLALGTAIWVELALGNGGPELLLGFGLLATLAALALFLVRRIPENPVSWVLAGAVFSTVVNQAAYSYFVAGWAGAQLAFVLHNVLLWASLGLMGLLILLFPTGRPPSPRWNWVIWLAGLGSLSQMVRSIHLAVDLPLSELVDGSTGSALVDSISFVGQAAVALAIVAALVGLIVRFLRSRGVERLQMMYVVPSFTCLAAFWVIESVWEGSVLSMVLLGLGGVTLPIAIVLSIIRYRLYEIDRIVSRTLAYLIVIVVLGSLFAFGVIAIPNLVIGTGSAPPLVVAASTLAVAALFNPMRRRALRWVDRRFNRSRYDAEGIMNTFAGSLRDKTDLDSVVGGWVGVVSDTMQPSSLAVWVKDE